MEQKEKGNAKGSGISYERIKHKRTRDQWYQGEIKEKGRRIKSRLHSGNIKNQHKPWSN